MADPKKLTDEDATLHKDNLVGMLRLRADNKWVTGVTDQVLFKAAADLLDPKGALEAAEPPVVTPGYNELTDRQQQGKEPLPDPAAKEAKPGAPTPHAADSRAARHA
jgi:hypothetical protein